MSADNSITLNDGAGAQAGRPAFAIPEELGARYQVRTIETPDNAARRVGLFLPGDRINPALEIANERIIARAGDEQTVASLVKLAQHNGWEKIDVEGSPEFRKAVWAAATREGLTVSGYEPTFAEQEQAARQRREDAERRDREAAKRPVPSAEADAARNLAAMEAVASTAGKGDAAPLASEASPGAKRDPSAATSLEAADTVAAQERAVVQRVLERSIGDLEARGDPRAAVVRVTASALIDQIYGEPKERSGERSLREPAVRGDPQLGPQPARSGPLRDESPSRDDSAPRRPDSERLAELFRHGAAETITAEPRLANAREAQIVMELHIAEVFKGDAAGTAAANLESRHMISDVLRRGLDVAVREPTQERQIEPIRTPKMER